MKKPVSGPEGNPIEVKSPAQPEKRKQNERRNILCDGFAWIPIIGWYCRREQARRRENDKKNQISGESRAG